MEMCVNGDPVPPGGCNVNSIDLLYLYAIFTDHAGPGLHGVESAGATGGIFHEKKANGFAVRRPLNAADRAIEATDLLHGIYGHSPDEDVFLDRRPEGAIDLVAFRQESQAFTVRRPCRIRGGA